MVAYYIYKLPAWGGGCFKLPKSTAVSSHPTVQRKHKIWKKTLFAVHLWNTFPSSIYRNSRDPTESKCGPTLRWQVFKSGHTIDRITWGAVKQCRCPASHRCVGFGAPQVILKSSYGLGGDFNTFYGPHPPSPFQKPLPAIRIFPWIPGSFIPIRQHMLFELLQLLPLCSALPSCTQETLLDWMVSVTDSDLLHTLSCCHATWLLSFPQPWNWQFQQCPMWLENSLLVSLDLSVIFNILVKTMITKAHAV